MSKQVLKWHTLEDGTRVGKWCGQGDVRGFRPVPDGYSASAADVEYHPVTGRFMGKTEWWIFLTPNHKGTPDA